VDLTIGQAVAIGVAAIFLLAPAVVYLVHARDNEESVLLSLLGRIAEFFITLLIF
jgi:hypothetical protein